MFEPHQFSRFCMERIKNWRPSSPSHYSAYRFEQFAPERMTKNFLATIFLATGLSTFLVTTTALGEDSINRELSELIKLSEHTEVWNPEPEVVNAPYGKPPSDAVVLFDGRGLDRWESATGGAASWAVDDDGSLTVVPGTGDIRTLASFCDVQLHLEWRTPVDVEGMEGQQRNNSGVFFQERYEIQILDSWQNSTYVNGQAASLYKQSIPLVNATRPPGEWQSYDIIFTAPRFTDNKLANPGYITVLHNGVLVQNHVRIQGATVFIGEPKYEPHGCAPLKLQDHSNPVSFRSIWVRAL